MKQEQYRQEEMIAIHYLNQTLELSLESGSLQQELKDGVLLCKWVFLRRNFMQNNNNRKKNFLS